MLITILMFIFQNFCPTCFFGQIWFRNLDFFKLTEIWYGGTLLYAYYCFNVYFSHFFSFVFFVQNWSQTLQFFKLTDIWYRGRLLYVYFDFSIYFFKVFVIHLFLGKFGPKIWRSPNWLNFGTRAHCYMLISFVYMYMYLHLEPLPNHLHCAP